MVNRRLGRHDRAFPVFELVDHGENLIAQLDRAHLPHAHFGFGADADGIGIEFGQCGKLDPVGVIDRAHSLVFFGEPAGRLNSGQRIDRFAVEHAVLLGNAHLDRLVADRRVMIEHAVLFVVIAALFLVVHDLHRLRGEDRPHPDADPDTPAEIYREFMTDINGEIDRENQIINDLLALVKLDRKNGDMHIAEVSVNEMLELLLKRIKPIAQKNDVELILESYRKVLAEVDEVKLALALSNLIENGVKYNREGGYVKVALDCDHKYFTITVSDNGIGIPESSLELIFDRFYRVDKTRARQSGGTGLGLSIAKSVVLMHHGTLHVDSVEGEGTTFEVKLPLNYVNDAE